MIEKMIEGAAVGIVDNMRGYDTSNPDDWQEALTLARAALKAAFKELPVWRTVQQSGMPLPEHPCVNVYQQLINFAEGK